MAGLNKTLLALPYATLALVSACAHEPGIEVRTVEIIKPVPIACVAADQIPDVVAPLGTLPANAVQAADVLAARVLELRAVNRELRALLAGCIG